MATRSTVLQLYRQILRHSRLAKTPQGQIPYVDQAKAAFRLNISESNPQTIESLITKAKSKLGFLKIVTPNIRRTAPVGKQNYVFREGEGLIEIESAEIKKTSFKDNRIDPDDLARHRRLLEYALSSYRI